MVHVFTTTWISSTSGPASYSASPRSKFMLSTTLLQVFLLTTLALTQARPRDPDHYLTPWQRYSFSAFYIYIHVRDFFSGKIFYRHFQVFKKWKISNACQIRAKWNQFFAPIPFLGKKIIEVTLLIRCTRNHTYTLYRVFFLMFRPKMSDYQKSVRIS